MSITLTRPVSREPEPFIIDLGLDEQAPLPIVELARRAAPEPVAAAEPAMVAEPAVVESVVNKQDSNVTAPTISPVDRRDITFVAVTVTPFEAGAHITWS